MKPNHALFILSLQSTLVTCATIKKDTGLTSRAGESILEEVDLVGHWSANRVRSIEDQKKEYQIKAKDGKLYPLIQLDCGNTGKEERSYKFGYDQVCTNFCFNRHCDPSTKDQAKPPSLPGYQIYTRSKKGTNTVRRVSGGYSVGVHGPCSKKNGGTEINFFHDAKNMVSLEEFPMAFMLEGGLQDIAGSKIGLTSLLPNVKRSVTFRCIPHKENISAGSKIFNMVKQRGVEEGQQFFLDIVNYQNTQYCDPKTTCENDGHQFVGLRSFDEADLKTPGVAQPILRPGSGSGRPATPPDKMIPPPSIPGAPSKKIPMDRIQQWIEDSRAIIYEGAPPSKSEATEEDEDAIYPLPAGGQDALESKFQITRWQYFPFAGKIANKVNSISIANGFPEKGSKELKPFIDPATENADRDALAAEMAGLNIDCGPETPSRNGKRELDTRVKGGKANKAASASACSRKVPTATKSQKSPDSTSKGKSKSPTSTAVKSKNTAKAKTSKGKGAGATKTAKAKATKTKAPKSKAKTAKAKATKTEASKSKATKAPKSKATEAPKSKAAKAPKSKAKTAKAKPTKTKASKSKATKAPKSKATKAPKSKATKAPKSKATKAPKSKATKPIKTKAPKVKAPKPTPGPKKGKKIS